MMTIFTQEATGMFYIIDLLHWHLLEPCSEPYLTGWIASKFQYAIRATLHSLLILTSPSFAIPSNPQILCHSRIPTFFKYLFKRQYRALDYSEASGTENDVPPDGPIMVDDTF